MAIDTGGWAAGSLGRLGRKSRLARWATFRDTHPRTRPNLGLPVFTNAALWLRDAL